jgi:hypothetical protein
MWNPFKKGAEDKTGGDAAAAASGGAAARPTAAPQARKPVAAAQPAPPGLLPRAPALPRQSVEAVAAQRAAHAAGEAVRGPNKLLKPEQQAVAGVQNQAGAVAAGGERCTLSLP